jgi:Flp pilus assembly protein TadG
MMILRFARDNNGAVLVEATIMMTIMFVLGSVDFLFAFYQWNAAAKAVQVGARIAAVSDPVATGLNGLSADIQIPEAPTTITGEDLYSCSPMMIDRCIGSP